MESSSSDYTDRHRTFLKAISSHGTMEVSYALKLLKDINEAYDIESSTEENLDELIAEINNKIAIADQKIKKIRHDVIDKDYIVLVSTIEDDINMKQSQYSALDREYFRILLQELTLTEYKMQRIVALNLISELKSKAYTKNHAEEMLDEWINAGYFLDYKNLIYFGPRTIGEFSDTLAQHFPEYVKKCILCMAAVLMGKSCQTCDELFHKLCLKKAFRKSLACPKCKAPWNQPV